MNNESAQPPAPKARPRRSSHPPRGSTAPKSIAARSQTPRASEAPVEVTTAIQRGDDPAADDIDLRAIGLGPSPARREAIARYVVGTLGLCAIVAMVGTTRYLLTDAEPAATPSAGVSAPLPSVAPAPAALPVVARIADPPPPATAAASPSAVAPPVIPVEALPASRPPPPAFAPVAAASPPAPRPSSAPPVSPASTAISPPASATTSEPPPADGFLNMNSIPASLIVLDGKPIGSTPKVRVQVTPGAHKVVFTNSDLGVEKEVSVTVGTGETGVASARLRE